MIEIITEEVAMPVTTKRRFQTECKDKKWSVLDTHLNSTVFKGRYEEVCIACHNLNKKYYRDLTAMNKQSLIAKWEQRKASLDSELKDCVREHDFISANNFKGAVDAIKEFITDLQQLSDATAKVDDLERICEERSKSSAELCYNCHNIARPRCKFRQI